MIWALTLKPGHECTHQGLEKIHLSLASLECRPGKYQSGIDGSDTVSYLLLKTCHSEQVLCTLEKGHTTQQNLDLVLQPRERVTFSVEGSGIVYVTGYSFSLPEDENDGEEEGIMGWEGYEERNPLHTVVKQEPEDNVSWEQRCEGGESEDGDSAPYEDSVLVKEEPGEISEDEETRNDENQGEISAVDESSTAVCSCCVSYSGSSGLCTRNSVPHTNQLAGDVNECCTEVAETQQTGCNAENEFSFHGIASRKRTAVHAFGAAEDANEGYLEVTDISKNVNRTRNENTPSDCPDAANRPDENVHRRRLKATVKRALPSRRGDMSSGVLDVPSPENHAESQVQKSYGQQNAGSSYQTPTIEKFMQYTSKLLEEIKTNNQSSLVELLGSPDRMDSDMPLASFTLGHSSKVNSVMRNQENMRPPHPITVHYDIPEALKKEALLQRSGTRAIRLLTLGLFSKGEIKGGSVCGRSTKRGQKLDPHRIRLIEDFIGRHYSISATEVRRIVGEKCRESLRQRRKNTSTNS